MTMSLLALAHVLPDDADSDSFYRRHRRTDRGVAQGTYSFMDQVTGSGLLKMSLLTCALVHEGSSPIIIVMSECLSYDNTHRHTVYTCRIDCFYPFLRYVNITAILERKLGSCGFSG